MHLNRLGVAFCEEGKLEKRIVNDKRTFPDLREHRPVDLVHVENCRALAACVDLDEANVGAMRIEARPVCMPSLLKTSFGSRPSRSWSRVSFLIAISALRRRHYGPAHKIPDSPPPRRLPLAHELHRAGRARLSALRPIRRAAPVPPDQPPL